jgi:hypothetical protein
VMTGVGRGIARGARSLDDLARRLWQRVRFRRFRIRRRAGRQQLWGLINPWLLLADGRIEWSDRVSGGVGSEVRTAGKRGFVVGLERTGEGAGAIAGLNRLPRTELTTLYRRLATASSPAARQAIMEEARQIGRLVDELVELLGRTPSPQQLGRFLNRVPEGPARIQFLDDFVEQIRRSRDDIRLPASRAPEGTTAVPRQKSSVRTSHDAGVEGGRARATDDGIHVIDWNNPRSHIGDYGRGLDDVGRQGDNLVVLEWKGEGSRLARDQMSPEWIARKIVELMREGDPMGRELLQAAMQNRLRGRVYHTRISRARGRRGELDTRLSEEIVYTGADVERAFLERMRQLHGG